jgi:hypothetical protein
MVALPEDLGPRVTRASGVHRAFIGRARRSGFRAQRLEENGKGIGDVRVGKVGAGWWLLRGDWGIMAAMGRVPGRRPTSRADAGGGATE